MFLLALSLGDNRHGAFQRNPARAESFTSRSDMAALVPE
jgi:hypothetical protein